eukprot:m.180762 g.180762  ORF g.180762 m.180762 type:complete len:51 (-) comp18019_c0_seq1:785-937(-)
MCCNQTNNLVHEMVHLELALRRPAEKFGALLNSATVSSGNINDKSGGPSG